MEHDIDMISKNGCHSLNKEPQFTWKPIEAAEKN